MEQELKGALLENLDTGDQKTAALDDGTPLGKVSKVHGRRTPQVVAEQALLDWVMTNHPEEIDQPQIRPAYRKKLLDSAKTHGQAVDETTGEVVPGIELREGDPYISFRGAPGYELTVAERWNELINTAIFPELNE